VEERVASEEKRKELTQRVAESTEKRRKNPHPEHRRVRHPAGPTGDGWHRQECLCHMFDYR
jgi:hypothetical protein